MAKRRRKTRTHLKGPNNSAATATDAPKSFVIRSGHVGRSVSSLVQDVRKVMEPNTAIRLKERKSNKLRDFVAMSGPLGVSHLLIFNQTDAGVNLRIGRCPRGPTCTFRVNKFALTNDVMRSQRRPRAPGGEFATPPLLVLNNFGGEARHLKLLVTVFQHVFPPIQVQSMRLSQARRVVLLSYNAQTGTIEWRHYLISVRPVGVSRSVRRVIEGTNKPGQKSSSTAGTSSSSAVRKGKSLPNLGNVGDISEYVLGRSQRAGSVGAASDTDMSEAESEVEDINDPNNAVELFQRYIGRNNDANEQRAVRLREIGPRMELRLIKIEDGMAGGETLYHDRVKKTAKEAAALKQSVSAAKKLKEQRRAEQEANVARKKEEKEARKTKKNKGDVAGAEGEGDASAGEEADDDGGDEDEGLASSDDDFEYEDRFADAVTPDQPDEAGNDGDLFDDDDDDDDDLGADDGDVSLSEGDGEGGDNLDESEDEDAQGSEDFSDEDEDDEDPIPVGGGLQPFSDDEDEDDDARGAPAASVSKRRRTGPPPSAKTSKSKARPTNRKTRR